jgi:hypothetical protein
MSDPSMSQSSPHATARSHSRFRAPAHAVIVVIAAVGSIATTPARWHVSAPSVATTKNGKGQLVTIEASAEPKVTVENGAVARRVLPEGPQGGAWTGRADYFVPPSETLKSVEVIGICTGGLCTKCEPPPGAFARIASTVDVESWTLDTSAPPATINLNAPENDASFRVIIAATRPPAIAVKLATPIALGFHSSEVPGTLDPKDDRPDMKRYAYNITWYKNSQGASGSLSSEWTLTATISGYCKEPGPCVAPTSERVNIVSFQGPPGSGASASPPGAAPVGSAGR